MRNQYFLRTRKIENETQIEQERNDFVLRSRKSKILFFFKKKNNSLKKLQILEMYK